MVAVRKGSSAGLAIVGTVAMGWAACGDSETTGPALDPPLEGGLDVVLERDEFRPDSTYPDVDSATPDADADADAKVWPDARPEVLCGQGTASNSQGTASNSQGTESDSQGTESDSQGTESDSQGTESDSQGTESDSQGTVARAFNSIWIHFNRDSFLATLNR